MTEFDITQFDNPVTGQKIQNDPEIAQPFELQERRMKAYRTVKGAHDATLQQFSDNFKEAARSPYNVNKNTQALMDIDIVPDDLLEEWKEANGYANNFLESLNIASPDEIDEWKAKGKMGIGETMQRILTLKGLKYLPFVGTTAEVGYNVDMLSAMNRMKHGQKISDVERDLLVDYLRELKEIQVRGTTLPSKALTAMFESVPFMVEFIAGVAAAPETFGGSLSVSAYALSKAAGKKAAKNAVQKALTEATMTNMTKQAALKANKEVIKSAYNSVLKAGSTSAIKDLGIKESAKIVAKTTPQNIIAANFGSKPLQYMTAKNVLGGIADRQLNTSFQITDAGEAVFQDPENIALSIMKSFGSAIFDNYTETMGWMVGAAAVAPVKSYFAKPLRKILPDKFFTDFEKLVTSRYGMPAAQALKKYGYDGVIEEMGEELLNRFLCQTFGINGLDSYTLDGFMNNVFYADDPEQWLVEALSFAAMGGAAHGTAGTISAIRENIEKQGNEKALKRFAELANKQIYSPAEFYLEQGLIKINGSQSAAEQALRDKFIERGVDADYVDEFFKSASELEIRNKLKEYFDEDAQDEDKSREQAVKYVADVMMKNRAINKEQAERYSQLAVSMFEKMSEQTGISINELVENVAPEVMAQEQFEGKGEELNIQDIEARLQEIEQEIETVVKAEEFDADKFDALEKEWNELDEKRNSIKNQLFQSIDTAGAESGEEEAAKKEWEEKGENSSFFKKWFGDSKVVDENGSPLKLRDNEDVYIVDGLSNNGISKYTYKGSHRAPSMAEGDVQERIENSEDVNLEEVAQGFHNQPADYFSRNGARWYGYDDTAGMESAAAVGNITRAIKAGKENTTVTVYRAIPNNVKNTKLKNGDWVTLSRKYAETHGEHSLEGEYQIIEDEVPAKYVWWDGNDIREWGYDNGEGSEADLYVSIQNPAYLDAIPETWREARQLRDEGYDGVITPDGKYLVLEKSQIKSIHNTGMFDKNNPNIYYQTNYNPLSFDKLQRKDGRYVDIEYYDNSDVKSVKPLNIRNLKFSNIEDVKKIKKNNIKDAVFGGKDKIYIKNKKSDIYAGLSASNLKEIISSVFSPEKESSYARLEKEIITNVQTIFENAIPILKHPELKNENLYDTQIIHRFALPVKIGGNNFLTMITVKERTDHKQVDIDEFAIYDLKSQIRKMPDRSSMSEDLNKSGQSRSQASKYSINDLTDFIKGNIKKYAEPAQSKKYYQFIGEKGAANLDKSGYNITSALNEAKEMEQRGEFKETIRKKTGWFRGADKKWRFEISDKDAELINPEKLKYHKVDETLTRELYYRELDNVNENLSELVRKKDNGEMSKDEFDKKYQDELDYREELHQNFNKNNEAKSKNLVYVDEVLKHDKLFAAYPRLRDVRLQFIPTNSSFGGRYTGNIIQIPEYTLNSGNLKKVLMHEIQHYIQDAEDFNWGGSPEYVEMQIRQALDIVEKSETEKKRKELISILEEDYENHYVLACALQASRVSEKEETLFKTWWWSEKGSWYVPRKTRKKEYRAFMNEWVQKFFDSQNAEMKEKGKLSEYRKYCQMNIDELRRLYRNSEARRDRIRKKTPRDIAVTLRRAIRELDETSEGYSKEELRKELYRQLAGETEARNAASRMDMTDEERKEKSPKSTQDYSDADQLVVFSDGSTLSYSMPEGEQRSVFEGNNIARDAVNKLENVRGFVLPSEKIIVVLKNADESTIPHELAHIWLDFLEKNSEHSEILKEDLAAVRKFLKNDGEPFTREQHEKFARSFEVYLRSGYAKNNKLKKIFEDFKNFLLAIYDDIKKIMYPEAGELKTFTDEEIQKIEGLFDRLLTTEKARIRATVFDKIAEIDNKIEEIKKNEKNELQELDELWKADKEHLKYLNRQSDKKRKAEEYLELAETMTSRETKEMKEFKKRYKDATLDILSVATGYDRRFIANPRNLEKVQMALEKTEDRIYNAGGMMPEWEEFYSDTGVNYETDEVGGGYKLAEQAFEVLAENRYEKTLSENYEFEEIGKFAAKLEYLHAKVKTLRGEEKQAALEALYSLFNDMPAMPDDVVAELVNKLEDIAQEYEDDQKNAFNSRVLSSVDIIWQLQYHITKKLNDLKVYNPETRYKMRINKSHRLYRYIKDIKSVDGAKKQIRRINDFIIDDMRNNQRSLLHKEIQKQIKVNSKVIKVGSMSKGKFDWKTNTVFQELVEMNRMTREAAEKELAALTNIADAAKGEARDSFDENETAEFNKTNDFQDILKKEFLQYRSMRLQDLDVTHTIQLLQDILELKDKGRQAKSEEDFINKTQRWNTKNNLLDVLEVTKNSGAKFGANWVAGVGGIGNVISLNGGTLANWESLLNAIFNKDTAQKYSLLGLEAKTEIYARRNMQYFYNRAAEIYGFKEAGAFDKFLDYDYMQPLVKLFQEYDNEKYTYIQQVYSVNSPDGIAKSSIELSRAQMITMFAWSLNEQLEQRLFTQFGLNQIREMFEEKLSKEDKELAWALVDTCEQMREDINEVFIRTTGLSLPKVENYFPSKAERVQSDIDMYHDFFVKSSNPSFIKDRKVCNRIPMKPMAPLEILIPHINKTARYVVMSEQVNFLNQIFKDAAIKTKMQEIWGGKNGADIYQTLINKLSACTFTSYATGTSLVAGWLDTLSRNYITSSIGLSAKVTIGQLLSVVNYAENMPSGLWAKGFAETLRHPVENFKYMLENCEYLQTRLAGNSQNEIISILTSEKDKFRTVRNFMTSNVKWGDIIAITLGGKAYVDYLMQQGMTKEAAFEKFVEDTLRAQQAGTTSSISNWQTAQAKNCFTRMLFAFRNTDMQYERKFIDTLIQAKKGEIGKKEAIKKIFIYKVLNPFMFTSFLQNMSLIALFRALFSGDDPDETWGGLAKNAVEAIMLSGLNAYGLAGFTASSIMETIISVFDDEFKHFEKDVPVLTDIDHEVQKLARGDLELEDYIDALATGVEFSWGLPATKAVNAFWGLGDIAQGNLGVGASRVAGWGKYTSTKAWTGEEPEKEKKKKKRKNKK